MAISSQNDRRKLLSKLDGQLKSRLVELTNHVAKLRLEMMVDSDVDDEAMQAIQSSNRDLVMITMEREIRNISEIQRALQRMKSREYGICVSCDEEIPYRRLTAIPWTRVCVECAGGAMKAEKRPDRPIAAPQFNPSLG